MLELEGTFVLARVELDYRREVSRDTRRRRAASGRSVLVAWTRRPAARAR